MTDKVFLDTNILVYAHDHDSPDKKAVAQAIIFEGLREEAIAISAQVLSEFFVTVTQKIKKPMPVANAKREISLLSNLDVADIDVPMIVRAIDIKQQWTLSYWDSLIIAAAERTECKTVYSEDLSDGQRYGKVTVRNPFKHHQAASNRSSGSDAVEPSGRKP